MVKCFLTTPARCFAIVQKYAWFQRLVYTTTSICQLHRNLLISVHVFIYPQISAHKATIHQKLLRPKDVKPATVHAHVPIDGVPFDDGAAAYLQPGSIQPPPATLHYPSIYTTFPHTSDAPTYIQATAQPPNPISRGEGAVARSFPVASAVVVNNGWNSWQIFIGVTTVSILSEMTN